MAPGSVSGKYCQGDQAARSPRAHDASNDGMHDSPGGGALRAEIHVLVGIAGSGTGREDFSGEMRGMV